MCNLLSNVIFVIFSSFCFAIIILWSSRGLSKHVTRQIYMWLTLTTALTEQEEESQKLSIESGLKLKKSVAKDASLQYC